MRTLTYHTMRLVTMLVAASCGAGCGGAAAARRPLTPMELGPLEAIGRLTPRFFPGETITWKVTFAGVEGGRARLAVGEPGIVDGRDVVILTAQAESSGLFAAIKKVNDDVTSWIDVASGSPVRTESITNLGGTRTIVHATFEENFARLKIWRKERESARTVHLRGEVTHDAMSSLLMLRAWDAKDGARGVFYTLGGRTLWSTELTAWGREDVDGPLGPRRAIRMTGVSTRIDRLGRPVANKKPRTFTVWLSDDDQRIPVRIVARTEYGDIVVTAETYSAPVQ